MWSATGMLMTAVNICYGEEEKRDFVSFNLHALALGAGLALFGGAALALVAVLPAALALLPVPDAWGDVLGLVRWPILAGIVILALAIVYRYAPDRAEPKWQWISWGRLRQQRYGSWALSPSRPTSRRSGATTRPTARLAPLSFCCSGSI
jgi:membrane protein